MKRQISLVLGAALMASLAGCTGGTTGPGGDLGGHDLAGKPADMTDLTAIDPLAGNPQVMKVNTGTLFKNAQSPLWMASSGTLLFSDPPNNLIYQLTPPTALTSYRTASNASIGLARDVQGNLFVAENTGRQITRRDMTGSYPVVASMYQAAQFNGPNDLIVRGDGTIYFTDPQAKAAQVDSLYRIAPGGTPVTLLDSTMKYPDGIALSPDDKILYVAAATDGKVYKFPVAADGSVGARSDFATGLNNCDGLAVDDAGNVYVTIPAGVRIFKADGTARGTLAVPESVSNLGFGGADRRTLYITASTSLYQVQLQVPGRP
jgi:gluconolactonase